MNTALLQATACSGIVSLSFDGRQLTFSIPGSSKTYPAVSGKFHGNFSAQVQKDVDKGPNPVGSYWIDPAQLWTAGAFRDWAKRNFPLANTLWSGWGEHRITIHPLASTIIYNRSGFFIHGGDHQGSGGCIHLINGAMKTFVSDLKKALRGLPECSIGLTVKYP